MIPIGSLVVKVLINKIFVDVSALLVIIQPTYYSTGITVWLGLSVSVLKGISYHIYIIASKHTDLSVFYTESRKKIRNTEKAIGISVT